MGKSIPVQLGAIRFPTKDAALSVVRDTLNRYKPGQRVYSADEPLLHALLLRHPHATAKIGVGVDHFMVRSADFGTKCFWVVRTDQSTERFSYKECL